MIIVFLSGCFLPTPVKFQATPVKWPLPYYSETQSGNPTILDGLWALQSNTSFTYRIKGGIMYAVTVAPNSPINPRMILAKNIQLVNFPKFSYRPSAIVKGKFYYIDGEIEVLNKDIIMTKTFPKPEVGYNITQSFTYKKISLDYPEKFASYFSATAISENKTTSKPITKKLEYSESLPTTTEGKRWMIIIGISSYLDHRIEEVRYPARDAFAFYNWAIKQDGGGYPPAQIMLLLNKDATLDNIKNSLFNWLGQALEEDVVTIYFAGHGVPQSPDHPENLFLLPYNADYSNIASTGFPMWDIETALKRFIKAKKVVVIADACHSGGVGQAFDIARRGSRSIMINPISSGLQNLSKIGDGVVVLSASDEKQFSQESQAWGGGHGVFTYFLLKALNGDADYNKDGRVTLGELIPYLSEHVRRETRNAQSPTVSGRFDPAMSIGK